MISNYNPDVLSCLANLSSDEVFTPPQLANQMLDLLPAEIWSDPNRYLSRPRLQVRRVLARDRQEIVKGS